MDNPYILKVENFILTFTSILYEALPFIILGAVIAGILEEMLPQRLITRFLPRSRTLAIVIGALLGLIFPMCECGIIPVMRRLIRKGLPLSCCVAYLLAGPIINVVVMLSTFVAFSGMEDAREPGGALAYQMGAWWMTGMRVGLGFLVSVVTAHIVEWQYQKYGSKLLMPLAIPSKVDSEEDADESDVKRSAWQRLSNISETALHDFIDITVFLILGALLAALTRQMVTQEMISDLSRSHAVLSIGLMMLMAVVLCLCSEADAFVAASFVTLRPAAKLAFLVLGPMLDIKLYLMYTRVFRPRLIYTIFLSVTVQVLVYSYVTHVLWECYAPQFMSAPAPKPKAASAQSASLAP
ncbi:MAG TPA: permease [Gemmataceae bacterium]|nr:permease [Gemmataceae bacterium]